MGGYSDPCAAMGRVWVQLSSPMQDSDTYGLGFEMIAQ
jgi:hypothetical protein